MPFCFHVSVRFLEPFPIYKGIWVVFVSHVLRYYCISPGCYPRHNMYVGFIIVFYLAHVYTNMYYIVYSLVYWMHYSLYFVLVGIGMPPYFL